LRHQPLLEAGAGAQAQKTIETQFGNSETRLPRVKTKMRQKP